jgi:dGTP triphosphohydrolase
VSYSTHVADVENQLDLRSQACRASDCSLITGEGANVAYGEIFETPEGQVKLRGRTPISIDRDRILYSDAFRRQDDKFHVLFFGKTRRARNYTSHAVRAAHVARSVSGRLHLNIDLAEAIVLGSKVGGVPFLHVGKDAVADWVEDKLARLDAAALQTSEAGGSNPRKSPRGQRAFDLGDAPADVLPEWIDLIKTPGLRGSALQMFPVSRGSTRERAYSSGQQSYWTLVCNPFLMQPRSERGDTTYTAQVLYGIWRHSMPKSGVASRPFRHNVKLDEVDFNLGEEHTTYEAMIARYCDDITWALDNLSEASRVDSMDGQVQTAFVELATEQSELLPSAVTSALLNRNLGKLYSYFIDDLVSTSATRLDRAPDSPTEADVIDTISLSEAGKTSLALILEYLGERVFKKPAIDFRNTAVETLTKTALDVLFDSYKDALVDRVAQLGRVENWGNREFLDEFEPKLNDPVFRTQACVSLLITMSDRDVFDLIGMD